MSDNQLRREEAERASLLSAIRYDVTLSLEADPDQPAFRSVSSIDFNCATDGASTFLNLSAARLRVVRLNGAELAPEANHYTGTRLRLDGLREGHNRVEVEADCAYGSTGVGLHRFRDPIDGATYTYTHFEPFDAHRVLACFDQPNLKAVLTMHVHCPAAWTACANAPVAASETDGERTTWHFAPTPPLPPYLFAIAAGDYDEIEGAPYGDIPLRLMCRRSLSAYVREQVDEFLDITRRGLAHFEERFGHLYPFGTYTQVFTPEANMGAMEHPGCVTFNELFVHRGPVSQVQKTRRANVILHEMVHVMGFGDVVTMRDWGDLWLNETFATVEATIALDALGIPGAWVDFAGTLKGRALAQDQLSTTHPILVDAPDTDSIRANFDGITYHKGASVLRQLIAWVGDDAYAAGVRSYFREFFWANASRADFLAHQERHSGRDLSDWARAWLETPGVNTLVPLVEVEDGRYARLLVRQLPDRSVGLLRPHRVRVALYDRNGSRLRRRLSVPVEITGAETDVTELVGAAVADLVVVNDEDLTYAKLRFDPASLSTLLDGGLVLLEEVTTRALCWTALLDMARDAELPASRAIAAVAEQAPAEPDQLVLERVLAVAAGLADGFTADANRGAALDLLATTAAAEIRSTRAPLIWARCLATTARSEAHLGLLERLLEGDEEIPGLTVDAELRWLLLARLTTQGRASEAQVEAVLELDPTDAGHRRAAACLAARPTAAAKAQAWSAALDDLTLSRAQLLTTLVGFSSGYFTAGGIRAGGREQQALTAPYLPRFLEAVPRVWAERDYEMARVITEGLFPHEPADEASIEAVERSIAQPGLPLNCRRILMEGRDGLTRTRAARAADGPGG